MALALGFFFSPLSLTDRIGCHLLYYSSYRMPFTSTTMFWPLLLPPPHCTAQDCTMIPFLPPSAPPTSFIFFFRANMVTFLFNLPACPGVPTWGMVIWFVYFPNVPHFLVLPATEIYCQFLARMGIVLYEGILCLRCKSCPGFSWIHMEK